MVPTLMGTCAFTGNWACNEIFFKNLCFHSPTQAQENIVSKISTLEGVFLKDAFLETVYTGNVRMVGQTGEKISIFKQKLIRVDGGM